MCYKTPTHTHSACQATPTKTTEDVCVCASYAPRFVLRTSQKTSLIGPKSSAKNEPFFSAFCLAFFSSVFSFYSLSLSLYNMPIISAGKYDIKTNYGH